MIEEITLVQWFTIAAAVGGLLLGIFNTTRNWTRDRERLDVILEDEQPHIKEQNALNPVHVRVVNTGFYPVTLNDFHLTRSKFRSSIRVEYVYDFDRFNAAGEITLTRPPLPRLGPGEEFRFQIWRNSLDRPAASEKIDPRDVTGVCVITASGKRFRRRSGLLRRYLRGADNP